MPVRRTTSLPLALVVGVLVVDGVAATPAVAAGQSPAAAAVPQEPAAGEASLALDRSTRRLIQQGLSNEGFDPGTPDGLFGPRTRAAIRDWQQSHDASPTGYLGQSRFAGRNHKRSHFLKTLITAAVGVTLLAVNAAPAMAGEPNKGVKADATTIAVPASQQATPFTEQAALPSAVHAPMAPNRVVAAPEQVTFPRIAKGVDNL